MSNKPELHQTTEWQPIETAPKPSLLDERPGPVVELMWETYGGLVSRGYYGKLVPTWFTLPSHLPCGVRPTHWRPLND